MSHPAVLHQISNVYAIAAGRRTLVVCRLPLLDQLDFLADSQVYLGPLL